ncbi:hypothetical protein AAG604_12595 [Citromicrobium bathyomarinum]|uniref:hypothetical protein n=1 Tax=Citromicrobium sp. WPS32 TaxID=1634517 RepID=UPI0012E283EE|nr:hypothetical protein [Citromicrobium sp. WPS32]
MPLFSGNFPESDGRRGVAAVAGVLRKRFDHQTGGHSYTVFEYVYRDGGNYKAFGEIWLSGTLTADDRSGLTSALECGEFFIAEQVGVPTLYSVLEDFDGSNEDDHTWHAFVGLRDEATLPDAVAVWDEAANILAKFREAKESWRPELSKNFIV